VDNSQQIHVNEQQPGIPVASLQSTTVDEGAIEGLTVDECFAAIESSVSEDIAVNKGAPTPFPRGPRIIPMVPTPNVKERLSEAIGQIEAKVAALQTLLSEDAAHHHRGEAPSKNRLSTLTVDAHLQQEDNIDIVLGEDTPTRYFFILLKYSGASLTYLLQSRHCASHQGCPRRHYTARSG
jgi:hypothetical protein